MLHGNMECNSNNRFNPLGYIDCLGSYEVSFQLTRGRVFLGGGGGGGLSLLLSVRTPCPSPFGSQIKDLSLFKTEPISPFLVIRVGEAAQELDRFIRSAGGQKLAGGNF